MRVDQPSRPAPASIAPARAPFLVALAALLMAALVALAVAAPASASSQGNRSIARYDVDVRLALDGTAEVTIDFDFDFADTPGRGPYLTVPLRQAIESDPDHVRSYPVSDVRAESPTGAPARVNLDDTGDWLEIRIGEADIDTVSGVHRYVLRYTMRGMVNPGAGAADEDEFFWNVIGRDWEIPLRDLSVTVTGPAAVVDTICFAGPVGGTASCTSNSAQGSTAQFTQNALRTGEPFTIAVAFPAGSFVGAEPIIIEAPTPRVPFRVTPWTGGLAGGLLAAGAVVVVRRSNQRGRDEHYLGLTPGLAPAAGETAATGHVRGRRPIAVQFTPPPNVRPGEVGTLADEVADPRDVTATIIDLAVRGYLRIEEIEPPSKRGRGGDWRLQFLGGPEAGLAAYERELLDSLFATDTQVTMSGLRTTFASAMARVQDKLYQEVTSLGWFRQNPHHARVTWVVAGAAILVVGVAATIVLAIATEWALVGIPLALLGVLTMALASRAPARTAAGTAVLAQTLGFKKYLETAEANQLRFEEGEDLFSLYLPYAIVFGVAERWAGIFEQLARQGRAVPEPTWYVGPSYAPGYFWLGAAHFGSTVDALSTVATSAIAAPTPGSSGGSGFGGGGYSGGGGGGGGGGGW